MYDIVTLGEAMIRFSPHFIGFMAVSHKAHTFEFIPVYIMKNIIDQYQWFNSNNEGESNFLEYSMCLESAKNAMRSSFSDVLNYINKGLNQ